MYKVIYLLVMNNDVGNIGYRFGRVPFHLSSFQELRTRRVFFFLKNNENPFIFYTPARSFTHNGF